MKKALAVMVFLAAAGGLAWLVWFKPASPEEEETNPPTEVAVHIGKITRATLRRYVTAYGLVEPEPPGERPAAGARLAPSVAGVVTAVSCAEGERVDTNAVLFQLDSRAADVAVAKAGKAVAFAEKNLERQQKLIQVDGTSQKTLQETEQALAAAREDLAAAQTQQALLQVRAPFAGTVTRIHTAPGEAVDLTTTLAELVDLDRLVVSASVPGAELAQVKKSQPAEVLADQAVAPIPASVVAVRPQLDAKDGTAQVRAALRPHSGLQPGQFVKVRIVSEEHTGRLAVPVESVVSDGEGGAVIALVEGDQAVQKPVKTGLRDGGLVEVEGEGLAEGDTVVTLGAYGLPRETKIRVLAP